MQVFINGVHPRMSLLFTSMFYFFEKYLKTVFDMIWPLMQVFIIESFHTCIIIQINYFAMYFKNVEKL